MVERTQLDTWLQSARHEVAARSPDPLVKQQLLTRLRERLALNSLSLVQAAAPSAARRRRWTRWIFVMPLAAAALLTVLLGTRLLIEPPESPAATRVATPFFALVGSEALAAARSPIVVTSQVSRAELVDYGLPVDPARVDQPVEAEFLVTRAGVVLAVRFIE